MPRIYPEIKLTGERNECPSCGELFNSNKAFDAHRRGKFGVPSPEGRHCLTPEQMTGKGMAKNAKGFWVTELMPQNAPRGFRADDPGHGNLPG
jgi:hypothetical protein